jgi:ornithine cyclodeaminase/alanine dehydrogenase-like protein (mu-crystallin family)
MALGVFSRITRHFDRQGSLMAGMMDRLDIDVESFAGVGSGMQAEKAMRACAFCRHGEACQAWQTAHPQGATQAPIFCPNRAFWAAHRHE